MIRWWAVFGLVFGLGNPLAVAAEPSANEAFDAGPLPHWVVQLPARRVPAARHVERSAPLIAGDDIFVGAAYGEGLYRFDRRNGALRETYASSGSVESGAALYQGRIYFGDTAGIVYCYTLDGRKLWSHATEAPVLVKPTVVGGRVFVENVRDLAVALDAETGTMLWQYQRKAPVGRGRDLALYASAPALVLDGETPEVLFGFSDGSVVGLDAVRGDLRWEEMVGEGRYPDVVAAPAAGAGAIFVSGYFGPLVALDAETHAVRWRADAGAAAGPIVVQRDGVAVLIHPGTDGMLRAFDAATGAEVWTWSSGSDGALTTPVETPAGLVVASSDGGLWIIDAATGAIRWKNPELTRLGGIDATPAVDGRQIVFVTGAARLHSRRVPRVDGYETGAGDFRWARDAGR